MRKRVWFLGFEPEASRRARAELCEFLGNAVKAETLTFVSQDDFNKYYEGKKGDSRDPLILVINEGASLPYTPPEGRNIYRYQNGAFLETILEELPEEDRKTFALNG